MRVSKLKDGYLYRKKNDKQWLLRLDFIQRKTAMEKTEEAGIEERVKKLQGVEKQQGCSHFNLLMRDARKGQRKIQAVNVRDRKRQKKKREEKRGKRGSRREELEAALLDCLLNLLVYLTHLRPSYQGTKSNMFLESAVDW